MTAIPRSTTELPPLGVLMGSYRRIRAVKDLASVVEEGRSGVRGGDGGEMWVCLYVRNVEEFAESTVCQWEQLR